MKLAALLLLSAGCLGPLVDDTPAATDVLPPGSTVPAVSGDLASQIAEDDGLDGTIPRLAAFSAGQPVALWDLGPAPDFAAPMFVLTRHGTPIAHAPIVESVPGDPSYTPFRSVLDVEVTGAYQGEVLPSLAALQEAEAAGLVGAPTPSGQGVDELVVGDGVTLDGRGAPDDTLYVRGVAVRAFHLQSFPLADSVHVPPSPRYVLHREGEDPLSEPLRHVDLDGDGDTLDSNDLYTGATPLCDTIEVAVPTTIASIDTSRDQTVADLTDATQLFDPAPTADVLAFTDTGALTHCALEVP